MLLGIAASTAGRRSVRALLGCGSGPSLPNHPGFPPCRQTTDTSQRRLRDGGIRSSPPLPSADQSLQESSTTNGSLSFWCEFQAVGTAFPAASSQVTPRFCPKKHLYSYFGFGLAHTLCRLHPNRTRRQFHASVSTSAIVNAPTFWVATFAKVIRKVEDCLHSFCELS